MAEYKTVARVEDLKPGEGKSIDVNKESIALFKIGEEFFAVGNICPHRGGPLGDGYLNNDVVSCPWHGWQFNVKTGEAVSGPAKIKTYPVKIEVDEVKVLID